MTNSSCVGTPHSWNVWCRRTWATWSRLSRGRRVRARCLVALIGVKTKNHHHLTLALLCFGCSCEPVVPGPCARWIRVARQRWASSMFDPVLRQRFCHRRHLGGRWWDSHYGRQPRYWFKKPPTKNAQPVQENEKKKKKILYARILAVLSLDPSGNAGMKENGHPPLLMNDIFFCPLFL